MTEYMVFFPGPVPFLDTGTRNEFQEMPCILGDRTVTIFSSHRIKLKIHQHFDINFVLKGLWFHE